MNSGQLFEKSLNFVPGGVHSPVRSFKGLHTTPRFIKRGDGAFIYDEDGKNYIDFCMSFGPLIAGHKNPSVESAVRTALDDGWSFGACERYSLELAEFILERLPHMDQIRFMNSGTEAVMTAIRLARGITGKKKILKFDGCYHGHMDSMLIKAGSGLAATATASSAGVTPSTSDDTLIVELGDLEAVREAFETHQDIAGVFLEPLPANNGIMIQERSFIAELRKLCDQYHSLLVFDEVISGFRVGFQGMMGDLDIKPDLVTYGKIIGGGFPVGAVAGSKSMMEHLAPLGDVYQAGTLSANPVAMRAGLATMQLLTEDFYANLEKTSKCITEMLRKWLGEHEDFSNSNIVQYKSLFWMTPEKLAPKKTSEISPKLGDFFYKLFENFLKRGIYLSPNGYEIGFVSSSHTEALSILEERLWS